MGGFALDRLSTAVSKAGGLGLIGATNDFKDLDSRLAEVEKNTERSNGLLPVGVGIIVFMVKMEEALPVLEKYKPAVVWFFAAQKLDDYAQWSSKIHAALPQSQVWIQVGSVEVALEVAANAKPDVMCVQGADAGGHGFEKGAGIISLLPEISDALAQNGHKISLVAAGGISDGRSAAAALALGAQGVVVGTRFLAAQETNIHPTYQKAIIAANDGGQSTIRSKLFDNLRGPNMWPYAYDGRSIIMQSFNEHQEGADIEDIRKKHNEAVKGEDAGFDQNGKGRAAMWAGTGVGFAKKVQPAAEIVEELRSTATKALKSVVANL